MKYPHIVYEEYSKANDDEQPISVEDESSDSLEGLYLGDLLEQAPKIAVLLQF